MTTCFAGDGLRLNYRIDAAHPDAAWLVFGNSLMTDLSVWDSQMSVLAGRWNILRYDQRGHGGSDVPSEVAEIPVLAEDLLAVIDAAGISRCTYIGLSMGVPTGLAAFVARPSMFERLVLVDGQARSAPTGRAFWEERIGFAREHGIGALADQTVKRWLRPARHGSAAASSLHEMIARTPFEGFVACASALRQYDHSAALSRLDLPVHFIVGADDGALTATMAAMSAEVPRSSFTPIADAGHVPNFERPAEFNRILLAALVSPEFQSEVE